MIVPMVIKAENKQAALSPFPWRKKFIYAHSLLGSSLKKSVPHAGESGHQNKCVLEYSLQRPRYGYYNYQHTKRFMVIGTVRNVFEFYTRTNAVQALFKKNNTFKGINI